jgi:hypothetical protein
MITFTCIVCSSSTIGWWGGADGGWTENALSRHNAQGRRGIRIRRKLETLPNDGQGTPDCSHSQGKSPVRSLRPQTIPRSLSS